MLTWQGFSSLKLWVFVLPTSTKGKPSRFSLSLSDFPCFTRKSGDPIYAAMPYAASFCCNPGSLPNRNDADQTINVISHEQMEAVTDPEENAWHASSLVEIGGQMCLDIWT